MSTNLAKRGDWVQVQLNVLSPEERSPYLPEDTKKVPLQMRVKGFLVDEIASLGATVRIKTTTDRIISGILVDINPKYTHNFGEPVPELINAGVELRKLMEEIDSCDSSEGDAK